PCNEVFRVIAVFNSQASTVNPDPSRQDAWHLCGADFRCYICGLGVWGVRREGNSPESLRPFVPLDKLDRVPGNAFQRCQLRYDASRELDALLVIYGDDGAHQKLTTELNRSAVLIQFRGPGWHRKGTFLPIFAG